MNCGQYEGSRTQLNKGNIDLRIVVVVKFPSLSLTRSFSSCHCHCHCPYSFHCPCSFPCHCPYFSRCFFDPVPVIVIVTVTVTLFATALSLFLCFCLWTCLHIRLIKSLRRARIQQSTSGFLNLILALIVCIDIATTSNKATQDEVKCNKG